MSTVTVFGGRVVGGMAVVVVVVLVEVVVVLVLEVVVDGAVVVEGSVVVVVTMVLVAWTEVVVVAATGLVMVRPASATGSVAWSTETTPSNPQAASVNAAASRQLYPREVRRREAICLHRRLEAVS